MAQQIRVARDTDANWDAGRVPAAGEPTYETDTHRFRIGDGETANSDLPAAAFVDGATSQLADDVRARIANNIKDQAAVEGAATAAVVQREAASFAAGAAAVSVKTDTGPDFQVGFDDGAPFLTATERDGITSKVKQLAALQASGSRLEELTADTGLAFAVVYENPSNGVWNLQWGIRDDGTIYQPNAPAAIPTVDIVCMGDSLTAGAGGSGTSYPSTLQSTLTAAGKTGTVRNLGIGGEQSPDIAARYAGGTLLATPVGGSIPASGAVNLTITNDDKTATTSFMRQGNAGVNPCTIAGVAGTLVWDTTNLVYTFTRLTTGSAVTFAKPQPLIPAAARDRDRDLLVVWPGRNNATQTARILSDIATMLEHQRVGEQRWLVMGVLNGANEGTGTSVYNAIISLNSTEKQLYGRRFIDIRRYLIDYGLSDAGITPTSQDQTDIAADIVPTSLRSDAIHLNATGYSLVGKYVYDRLVEMGWI